MTSEQRRRAREALIAGGRLATPEELPIAAWRDELLAAIESHQVVVVEGETGSGKSTQLPKLCIEAGRGVAGMIGHTQPRRVAARTIAERVAAEVGSHVGDDVGYTIRFTDEVSDRTIVKVMTDGILLAEIQRDPMLRRYDTVIVDEAHERSLNIDFILGYLRQLLPRRPDLQVIVTSATIDTARFARHFAVDGVDAPVVSVSGRTYPVEVRYRPFGVDGRDQVQAIADAVDELAREGPGDVLVFLSGEREIHDAADALRRRGDERLEILPLYARLSSHEQRRIFEPHSGRRVVLSTNVAETSLTVPGVRYVVDAGAARVSRYSRRLKVQRLPIEPVSRASADQRAGRCGRVAPGICIRLYAEEDYEARAEFTEPEILRTNLASVILQMTAAGLGDVDRFPFVEAPDPASVRDGDLLLEELAAIERSGRRGTRRAGSGGRSLTSTGRRLARLPVDPRLGRMILASEHERCTREVLVIAAALSIQDVRERPIDRRARADQLHARFDVPGSDLLSIVALWDHLRERQRELSGNQFRRLCRDELLNYLRVREWVDLYSQLRRIAGGLGIRPSSTAAHPDNVHRAVLAGHLSHIGVRDRRTRDFVGARNARFVVAPGSVLAKRPPEWVMAAELVETHRLFARRVAAIEPEWAESLGQHLVKRTHGEPGWDADQGRSVVTERVTLYGVPLVTDRVVGHDRVDPVAARAWFISKALVEGAWHADHAFIARNRDFLVRCEEMTARIRRSELVDDEMLFGFFDDRVPDDIATAAAFDHWWRDVDDPHLLDLTEEVLADADPGGAIDLDAYPDTWVQGDNALPLTYRFAPGEPLDGVTVHLPLAALNQIDEDGFDWQIAGLRPRLVEALVRSLPKGVRRELIPLAETTESARDRLGEPDGRSLVDALAGAVTAVSGVPVTAAQFDLEAVPDELRMHFVVSDDRGEVHDVGTDLAAIKRRLAHRVRDSLAAAAPIEERRGITAWDLGDLPRVVEAADGGLGVRAHPTLLDVGDSVALRVVSSPELQERAMRGGVRRLLILNAAPTRAAVERLLTDAGRLALARADIPAGVLIDDCIAAAVDHAMEARAIPWSEHDYEDLRAHVREVSPGLVRRGLTDALGIVASAVDLQRRLASMRAAALSATVADANAHLGRLVRPGFVLDAGLDRLADIDRYVRAIGYRLDHVAGAVERDQRRIEEVTALEERYARVVDSSAPGSLRPELVELRWSLEELRVATFAQPVGVRGQVSATRIRRALDER